MVRIRFPPAGSLRTIGSLAMRAEPFTAATLEDECGASVNQFTLDPQIRLL